MSEVSQLLDAASAGDRKAAAMLLPLVYDELRALTAARMTAEVPGHTLDATALVHDAYLRLVGEMAACIKANIEAAEPGGDGGAGGAPSAEDGGTGGGLGAGSGGTGGGPGAAARSAASTPVATVKPINAMSLLLSVLWARLTGARPTGETLPMEPMDTGTAGIGVMLGVSSVIGIALAAIVVVSGLNQIFKTS